ncbi:MAG: pyridoxal phosphate-dependent aminotransferase family protein [Chloroflexia bacterium]|nr:pyridoxal phosphate-dependent aminotransferase family protein [Chloroflexia bacterium]
MDLFEKCYNYTEAKEAIAEGYYPYFAPLEDTEGTEVTIRGHRLIMIGSNNYLGLTTHPQVRQAAIEATKRYGTSCTGSRFLNGNLKMIEELEEQLAHFMGKQAALVFSTGFQANLGTIASLVGRRDFVLLDKEDHASIVDGCRLSFGTLKRYQHNDMESLQRTLESCPPGGGKLVIVDGVFSMGGDLANLPEIIPLCQQYQARLMVDDAHSVGVMGGGRGTAVHFGLNQQVDLIMGTFSKSFASLGGFIVGDEPIIHYIRHHARSLIFSASIPPANTAAAMAALQIMQNEPERIERVLAIGDRMRREFRRLGFNTGDSITPIIPIIIGERMRTFHMWRRLYDEGVYVNPIIEPAVPPGMSLLRTSYMATHTDQQMDRVLEIFAQVGREVGVI